jgi:trans-2,3-dihydro-3-hydroxyanthranilate isomerase
MASIAHPAPSLGYFLLDVFTDQPFGGNPLAVFVDPGPLSDGQMQRIAAELNLSETAFVWSPARLAGRWRTRIFTPAVELPFAGHPTVGTGFLLANLGLATGSGGIVELELEEPLGVVPVTVRTDELGVPLSAELIVPGAPERTEIAEPATLVAVLGLTLDDLHPHLPVRGYSAGNPFSIVPVADVVTLGRARVDGALWEASVGASPSPHLFVVTPRSVRTGRLDHWQARMFAPAMGIPEDPATGAAAAAFAGYLAEVGRVRDDEPVLIEQGIEMGRPSQIRLTLSTLRGSRAPVVRVGGAAVVIGKGALTAPRTR